jgi:hypothetical protein
MRTWETISEKPDANYTISLHAKSTLVGKIDPHQLIQSYGVQEFKSTSFTSTPLRKSRSTCTWDPDAVRMCLLNRFHATGPSVLIVHTAYVYIQQHEIFMSKPDGPAMSTRIDGWENGELQIGI